MKKINITEYVRNLNKNDNGNLFIESKLNIGGEDLPGEDLLKIEADAAQYKLDKLSRELIQNIR